MSAQTPMAHVTEKRSILCVDCDGTLIKSDLLYESLCLLLKNDPTASFAIPFWLLRGKAYMKRKIAERVTLDAALLPYESEFVEFLRREEKSGRRLVLTTASDVLLAGKVAAHLGIFEEVIASDGMRNLSGKEKRAELCSRYGEGKFAYAGNAHVDMPIWEAADERILVSSSKSLLDALSRQGNVDAVFQSKRSTALNLIKASRIHQWVKNLLLFAPLIMAHQLKDSEKLTHTLMAFAAFCLCASSVYLTNDLLDLDSDRQHPKKRNRPFASGSLSLRVGLTVAPVLLAVALFLGAVVGGPFLWSLCVYFALTLGYSLFLKQIVVLDILVLAGLYSLRILAGGVAADVLVSQWLLAFSMFIFMSLACIKRFSELLSLRRQNEESARGRGYRASDLEQIAQFGTSAGYISVLVLALYVNSSEVTRLYRHPELLWLICPLLLYWVSRVWLLAHRGELHEDPIVFALRDKVSYLVGFLSLGIMFFAI